MSFASPPVVGLVDEDWISCGEWSFSVSFLLSIESVIYDGELSYQSGGGGNISLSSCVRLEL